MLESVYEVKDAWDVIKVGLVVVCVAEVSAIVHDKDGWDIINRNAFVFEESILLTYVSSADLYFLALFRCVNLLVKLLLELG